MIQERLVLAGLANLSRDKLPVPNFRWPIIFNVQTCASVSLWGRNKFDVCIRIRDGTSD